MCIRDRLYVESAAWLGVPYRGGGNSKRGVDCSGLTSHLYLSLIHIFGKGDMLYLQGNDPVRVQCAFVETPEVEKIANYISKQQGDV